MATTMSPYVLLPSFDADEFTQRCGTDAQAPNALYLALRLLDEQDHTKNEQRREVFSSLLNEREAIIEPIDFPHLSQGAISLVFHFASRTALGSKRRLFVTSNLLWHSNWSWGVCQTIPLRPHSLRTDRSTFTAPSLARINILRSYPRLPRSSSWR